MASEQFKRVGRGGAGNFHWLSEDVDDEATGNKDPEAQESSEQAVDAAIVADTIARKPVSEFVHTGRGGAGNYYSPKTLDETRVGAANSLTPQPRKSGYQGRGGAGNYMAKDNAEERLKEFELKEFEAERRDMIAETARRDVEMALKAPGKAHLPREGLTDTSLRG